MNGNLLTKRSNCTETKQKTLEELDFVFAVPTMTFAKYQLTEALPYWFKRWILFQRNATLRPLYKEERYKRASVKQVQHEEDAGKLSE